MTDHELDVQCAVQIMGWAWCEDRGLTRGGYWRIDDNHSMIGLPWFPSTDHNAAMEVTLKAIEMAGSRRWVRALLATYEYDPHEDHEAAFMCSVVTPRQRCEAALKCAEEGK